MGAFTDADESATAGAFAGQGAARELARSVDWRATPLGPVETWPAALRFTIRLCMDCPTAMSIWAGSEFTLLCNDGYLPFLGAKVQGAMGRPAREVWAEVWERLEPEFSAVALAGRSVHHQDAPYVLRRHGRDERAFFTFTLSPIRDDDGRILGILNVCAETTPTIDALTEAESKYRSLFNSIDEGFCIIELLFDEHGQPTDYRFLDTNPAFVAQTGLTDARGRTIRDLVPQHEEKWFEIYGAILRTGRATRFQQGAMHLDPPRWFDVYAFRYGPAESHQIAVLFNDVAARKRAEASLEAANLHLAEADGHKTEFLAVLSHELRNPLAPIRNSMHLLERAPADSEQAHRAREVIRRQTDHLTRLVDDLLDVTRISRGKIALHRQRIDLRDVTRKATEDVRSLFERAGVELSLEEATGPVWIDADPTRIAQVIGNLLHNAIKFTPAGGAVTARLEVEDRVVRVRIRDTGVGMEPGREGTMFEPFVQGDQGIARSKGGLGLGLSLVRSLVELHGGSVSAHSEGLGRGSELVVSLPLASSPATERPARQDATLSARDILLIEDNEDAAQTLADVLALEGHRVRIAKDGRSGLALARAQRPEVILCDVGLPDVDGYEVARTVRADPVLGGVRLVAVTGYAQPEDRERARQAGFDAHLAKPPEPEALGRALSGELRGRE